MNAQRKIVKNRSIKFTLISLIVLIVLFTVISMTIIIALTTQSQGINARRIGHEVIAAQSHDFLLQITHSNAREHNQIIKVVMDEAEKIGSFTAAIYDNAENYYPEGYSAAVESVFKAENGQYMNGPEEISSVFVPKYRDLDDSVLKDIQLSAYLDLLFPSIFTNAPNIEAIYFATPQEVIRYYPNIQLGEVVPPDFRVAERIWYVISKPENNPQGEIRWTKLYVDATGKGLVSTVAIPVYDRERNFVGVVGLDISLTSVVRRIEETQLLRSGYSFLIDGDGHVIALPDQGYLQILEREQLPDEMNTDLKRSPNNFAGIIRNMTDGKSEVESIIVGSEEYYVAYAPIENVNWSIGSVILAKEILQPVYLLSEELEETSRNLLLMRIFPFSLVILSGAIILGLFTTNRVVKPLQNLASSVQKMSEGHWEVDLPGSGNLEIVILSQSFKAMAEQVKHTLQGLENRVAERTQVLEKRSKQIQVAAEVARDATANRQLETILNKTVNLLHDRFGFIHVGAYLLDERKRFAVLSAANGQSGEELVKAGYKVSVGDPSSVGFCAATGQPRITQEADPKQQSRLYALTDEIRSDLAMPLKLGQKVIGVIRVASDISNAFDEEDVKVLQIVADQTAVAIDNARLFSEAQESLKQLQALYGRYSQDAWTKLEKTSRVLGYRYDDAGLGRIYQEEDGKELPPVSIPLEVRGKQIGSLDVWFQDEQMEPDKVNLLKAVGERIGQAMESARLFEETQERIAREQALNQVIASFSHSLDIDSLLQKAVMEMGQLPNVAEVSIIVGPPQAEIGGNGNGSHQ